MMIAAKNIFAFVRPKLLNTYEKPAPEMYFGGGFYEI